MIPVIPWSITLIILGANLTACIAVWWILSRAADRSGLSPAAQRRARLGTGIFLGGWLGAALLLAPAPASLLARDRFFIEPLIPIFALGSFAIVLLAFWLAPTMRRLLEAASVPALIAVQSYRAVGFVFLVLAVRGQLPAHFAQPAGWGDIAVGLTAPFVALAIARGNRGSRALAIGWNVIGLLDLFVAIGMGTGILAPILARGLGPRVPPAAAMGAFPMILVPIYAVPLSIMLHMIVLGRLRRSAHLGTVVATPA
jgi:hypothetical protein